MVKILLATLAVFVEWAALDMVVHGVILQSSYEATAQLWRPMEEMKMGLIYFTNLVTAFVFSFLYGKLVGTKGLKIGLYYGLLFGLAFGIPMGYGSYASMPIPYNMALTWFLGSFVEALLAGLLVGLIIKK